MIFLISILVLINAGCSIYRGNKSDHFKIIDTSYYSWFVNENERGTDIIIWLKNVKEGIHFDSVVFRGRKIPVYSQIKRKTVELKAVLPTATSALPDQSEPYLEFKSNLLIYNYMGEKYLIELPTLRREEMKYIKPL